MVGRSYHSTCQSNYHSHIIGRCRSYRSTHQSIYHSHITGRCRSYHSTSQSDYYSHIMGCCRSCHFQSTVILNQTTNCPKSERNVTKHFNCQTYNIVHVVHRTSCDQLYLGIYTCKGSDPWHPFQRTPRVSSMNCPYHVLSEVLRDARLHHRGGWNSGLLGPSEDARRPSSRPNLYLLPRTPHVRYQIWKV